jgi:hypothetical protein
MKLQQVSVCPKLKIILLEKLHNSKTRTSRDQTSLDFLSPSELVVSEWQLIVQQQNPTNVIPSSAYRSYSEVGQKLKIVL